MISIQREITGGPIPMSLKVLISRRMGMTNPDNFVDHRKAMIRLSRIVGSLASAYKNYR